MPQRLPKQRRPPPGCLPLPGATAASYRKGAAARGARAAAARLHSARACSCGSAAQAPCARRVHCCAARPVPLHGERTCSGCERSGTPRARASAAGGFRKLRAGPPNDCSLARGTPAEVDGLSNGGAGQKGRLGKQPTRLRVLWGESPLPSIASFGRLVYPGRGEVTNHEVLGSKRHGYPTDFEP